MDHTRAPAHTAALGQVNVATWPRSYGQHVLRRNIGRKQVEAMFSSVMPALKLRARRMGLQRRPDGYRIEPMPQMRWYS